MSWEAWPKADEKGLARFVLPSVANRLRLDVNRDDLLRAKDRVGVVRAIYGALLKTNLQYAREEYDPELERQRIRDPILMLEGAGEGTCLDLALLFAGLCSGNELLPLVVVLQGHALVVVSTLRGRREAGALPRTDDEGEWVLEGYLEKGDTLADLVKRGDYIAVECTGFARTEKLPATVPEGVGRQNGFLSFERALEAGQEQLSNPKRPFRFAVDPVVLQELKKFSVHEPPSLRFENLRPDLRQRLAGVFASHQLFGGRTHALGILNGFVAGPGGYLFVTGRSGSGKSALLANWIQSLEKRDDVRLAYHFINQQHGLAGQDDTLRTLCQQLAHAHGRPSQLPGAVADLEALYIELLLQPMLAGHLIVVLDGLDEANGWAPGPKLFPHPLPPGTAVVFSARETGRDWLADLGLNAVGLPPALTVGALDPDEIKDLLRQAGATAAVWAGDDRFIQTLRDRSQGDPFYLQFLVQDIIQGKIKSVADLEQRAPTGLKGYLDTWWTQLRETGGLKEKPVLDLLSYLLISLGRLTRAELSEISDTDQLDSWTFDDALTTVRRFVIGNDDDGFAICHPRLSEYLRAERISQDLQKPYREALIRWCADWPRHQSRYALTFYIAHLLAAAEKTEAAARAPLVKKLLSVMTNRAFQEARVKKIGDIPVIVHELERICRLASGLPELLEAPLLIDSALAATDFRETWLRPEPVFVAAMGGKLDEAKRGLNLFTVEGEWIQAALLIAAWLAVDVAPDQCREMVRQLKTQVLSRPPLPLLLERVNAAVGGPAPELTLPYPPGKLPSNSHGYEAAEAVRKMGGTFDMNTTVTGAEPMTQKINAGDETPTYIAEQDSPWLVSYAIVNPDTGGEDLLRKYIAIHASNPYPDYRNRSLWGVLGSVLCHPDAVKAREFAKVLAIGALSPSPVRYRENLPLTILALQARAGHPAAQQQLDSRIAQAKDAARNLVNCRGEGDNWGHFRRRLAGIAELRATLFNDQPGGVDLLKTALALPTGFAGYHAPASLTVAEACRISGDSAGHDQALFAAHRAAHNVQDPGFCARTTARVNAIVQSWRGPIPELGAKVESFIREPFDREFAPIHIVADSYHWRNLENERVSLPGELRQSATLRTLVQVIFRLPLPDVLQLNPAYGPDDLLPAGVQISIPDPKFAPILAAHFAGELLTTPTLSEPERSRLMQGLVPIAVPNATALDTLMARLLLSLQPAQAGLLAVLEQRVPSIWMDEPGPSSKAHCLVT